MKEDKRNNYSIFKFPAGEVQVMHDTSRFYYPIEMVHRIKNSDDIISLMQLASINGSPNCFIPYLPFSRMDRKIEGYAFSLKVFAKIINTAGFKEVSTLDVHSNVPQYLIKNFRNIDPLNYQAQFLDSIGSFSSLTMVIPDLGASKRYPFLMDDFKDIVQCGKSRLSNGNIIKTEVYGDVSGKDCIIFDDICDGGVTFIELAKALKEKGANKLYLFVTHGIFSKGLTELFKYYDMVGCTDSYTSYDWANEYLNNFKVIKI